MTQIVDGRFACHIMKTHSRPSRHSHGTNYMWDVIRFFAIRIHPEKCKCRYRGNKESKSNRWARLLKQQSSISDYRLPTKENKLLFSISVCSKQREVCCFSFLFAADVRKSPFFFAVRCSWVMGHAVMGTWRHGIQILGNSNSLRKKSKRLTENGIPGWFSFIRLPFGHCANGILSFVQTEEETNGSDPFANGLKD